MHNLNREKIIILTLAIPLFVLSFFLVSFSEGMFAIGASQSSNSNYESETVYESRECADGYCHDSGKKLIEFKGGDAECENYKSEDERMQCYSNNSQASFSCGELEDSGEVDDCYEKNASPSFTQNQGGGGTLVVTNSVTVGGSRMYMNGFDCNGEHTIQTGTNAGNSTAMTFRDGSRDVEYNGNLSTGGNGTTVLSEDGGVYFGSEVEYSETDLNSDGLRGQKMTSYNNFNGMNLNACGDMQVMANHNNVITIPDDGDDYEGQPDNPNYIEDQREPFAAVEIEKGLEVNGDMKADFMYYQGRFLRWSEPIRGHFVLYYNTEAEGPTKCEEPVSERDANPPTETPPLTSTNDPGGGSNNVGQGGYDSNVLSGNGNSDCDDSSKALVIPYDASQPDALDLSRSDIAWYGGNANAPMGTFVDTYNIDTTISDDSTCGHYNFTSTVDWPQSIGDGVNCQIVACGGSPGDYVCQAWDWCLASDYVNKAQSCSGYFNNIDGNDGYYGPELYAFIVQVGSDLNNLGRTNVTRVDVEGLCDDLEGEEECDGSGGFLWKPTSTRGGVAVLLPGSFPDGCNVTINGEAPTEVRGRTNPDRPTFFFAHEGCYYGTNVDVQADCSDGNHSWTILNGCNRCD